jgi:hypothetical protein
MWPYSHLRASKVGSFLRVPVLILCGVLSLSSLGVSRQMPAGREKVLTPEQQALQQKARVVASERDTLRAQAKQAFDAEMARQKAGDCPDAGTTYDANVCYGKAVGVTDQNLRTYEAAIRNLLGLKSTGQTPVAGPAGPQSTPQEIADFDRMEALWHSYLDAAKGAAFHQFAGGTGGPSFAMVSYLQLVRSHMAELNGLYDMLLRL